MHTNLKSCTFPIADLSGLKKKVLNWLRPFSTFCFLDNQHYELSAHRAEVLVAAGIREKIAGSDLNAADDFFLRERWLFGHLSYELTNALHHLPTRKVDKIGFPPFFFFAPQVLLSLNDSTLFIESEEPAAVYAQIMRQPEEIIADATPDLLVAPVLTREAYIQKIKALQQHILRGDCYEINFCQEFFAQEAAIDPFAAFQNLMDISPNPFSAFYRIDDKFLLCASPERFLTKSGNKLISQPIKGTVRRDLQNRESDELWKERLRLSRKEQAENVMVVDLVRNDLTKICKATTVKVDELFGVYSFPQVHQLISTISGELKENIRFSDILQATFPMGSMTGAPKHRVMQLIEEYEPSARGIFSGSVGYKAPGGDFDFNVVIRSIMYNAGRRSLSYQVGSGITFYSDAEMEWEECMLKAEAIRKVLS